MASAHVVEKGLSFERPRVRFGMNVIKSLLELTDNYLRYKYPINNFAFQSAIRVLQDYLRFHQENGVFLGKIEKQIQKLSRYKIDDIQGSTLFLNKKEYFTTSSFKDVIIKRRSIRNFTNKSVSLKKIERAIKLALNSPSVCNRQSWRVYVLRKKNLIDQVLNLQRGNKGFKDKIKTLLIVTTDLNSFQGFNERNQCFVDGGLFSMSLLLSLHFVKLASCPLNWSYNFSEDLKIRKMLKIRKSENIIILLAVGNMPPLVKVTRSQRKDLADTLRFLD